MSCYMVSHQQLNTIITTASLSKARAVINGELLNLSDEADAAKAFVILRDGNEKSVNDRYNESGTTGYTYQFKLTDRVSPAEAIRLLHNLDYQSCDAKDYYGSAAQTLIHALVFDLTKHISDVQNAPWGI